MSKGVGCVLAIALVLSETDALGAASPTDPAAILKAADAPYESFSEGTILLRAVVNDRGKKPATNLLELFVKGTEKSLCVFREGKQQGKKILTLGDKVWLIVPGASRPVPVSKTQRLMGAASFGDIARLRFADEYVATVRPEEESLAGDDQTTRCRVLDLAAKRKGAAYSKAVLWVGVSDGLARRLRLSLASGKEAKDVRFVRYDGERRLARMEIQDLLTAGGTNVTVLDFESYEKRPLDPAVFDLEGARAVP